MYLLHRTVPDSYDLFPSELARAFMLGPHSLSGVSGTSTSWNASIDLGIIEQIIERAPRTATSWPQVYNAYGEVLEE